ncbi:MAG: ATP/GTP-binding protein [Thermoplasmatota archaeon]
MEEPAFVYVVGTAGSGKSTFTRAVDRFFDERGLDATTVNLDPGAEAMPYEPDVDVREWILLSEVMEQYGLGPNGAQVMAADLLTLRAGELKEQMEALRPQWYVLDTAGQTELFVFRESGRVLVDLLGRERTIFAFLMDPFLARRPSSFVSQLLLSATTQFRFNVPVVNVLTKADLLKPEELERIQRWGAEPDALAADLADEQADMYNQLNQDVFRALDSMGTYTVLTPVSSETLEGIEDVYAKVQEILAGGDDAMSD